MILILNCMGVDVIIDQLQISEWNKGSLQISDMLLYVIVG